MNLDNLEQAGTISKKEAENAVDTAERLIQEIETMII